MKTKPHSLKKWMAMAACPGLLLLCGGGLFLRQANAVASVVSIDVSPSIELRVNQNEKVLACVPMNDDAHAFWPDMGDGESEGGQAGCGSKRHRRQSGPQRLSGASPPPSGVSVEDPGSGQGSPTAAGPLRRRGRHPAGQRLSGLRIDPDGHAGHVFWRSRPRTTTSPIARRRWWSRILAWCLICPLRSCPGSPSVS